MKRSAQRVRRDRGYAAILTALLLVPLMGFAGFAVDVGAWYSRASSLQRAADAASLAGVVWQPDFSAAQTAARAAAARNGFVHGVDGIEVNVVDSGENELEVEVVDTDVELFFAGLFIDDVRIARSATAEYIKPVPMGSPENFLGNDPVNGDAPNFWLATFGPQTSKRSGDRFHTEVCGGAIFCTGAANDEFTADGYFFTLTVAPTAASPLRIQLFDPVHHNYGDRCTETDANNGNGGNWLFADGSVAAETWYATNDRGLGGYPEERYEVGGAANAGGAAWCPGDNGLAGTGYQMTVIVRAPDNTPFDYTDNDVVCATRWGADQPTDQAEFVADLLDDAGRQPVWSAAAAGYTAPGAATVPFRDAFREWVEVCTDPTPEAGDYIIQIRTNADASDPRAQDPTIATRGRNRYALRAGIGSPGGPAFGSGVSLSADGRLPIFVNVPPGAPSSCGGIPTCFYIARVSPDYAGQRLQLDIFDLTDGSAIDLTFVPPVDSGLGSFTSCDFRFYDESGAEWDLAETGCTATAAANAELGNGGSNGDAISAEIDIPAGYTCNDADPFGCWVTVEMSFAGTPSDTATWSAEVSGDPIRLVE